MGEGYFLEFGCCSRVEWGKLGVSDAEAGESGR
jgi:hypothetical protein